jgi:signal transduction histidine kinase
LSFVLVLLFGQRFLPLLFVAHLLADLLVRHLPFAWSVELLGVAVIGGGYALGLSVLLRPATRFNPALASMRDLITLLAVAGVTAALVAISYVGLLVVFGLLPSRAFAPASLQFWVGDMIGIAVVAPGALIFLARGRIVALTRETAAQLLAILVALGLVFIYAGTHHFQLFYVLFLPIIWMAVRGGLEAVTIGILLTQIGLILGVQVVPAGEIDVTAFQALMLVLALTGLVAGALVNEHRGTEIQLRLHQDSLARLARLGGMGELAAAIAHEINQPLTAAGTYARMVAASLRSGARDDPELPDTATKAAAQVERAAEVVRALRALIRLDQTGRTPVSVAHLVTETLALSRPTLERHGVETRLDLAADLPPVMADVLQIEQVLLNLVRNAVEAIQQMGRRDGVVAIAARRVGPAEVEIVVSDNGPGFPPEFAGANLPPLASTKIEGLGVGLSLCRTIVELHGGKLLIGGGADGARVSFCLPVAEPAHG